MKLPHIYSVSSQGGTEGNFLLPQILVGQAINGRLKTCWYPPPPTVLFFHFEPSLEHPNSTGHTLNAALRAHWTWLMA